MVTHYPNDCDTGGTTLNTTSHLHQEFEIKEYIIPIIYFNAILNSEADVLVTVGGEIVPSHWISKPSEGIGVYHGRAALAGQAGPVAISLHRDGQPIVALIGKSIEECHLSDHANLNP